LPEEQAHLCPVRAYMAWISASQINTGYLFPKIGAGDLLATDKNEPMSSAEFLAMFHNHLLNIGEDPYPYGTQSFRRGGCQYLQIDFQWSIDCIRRRGGWSSGFSSFAIVKELVGDDSQSGCPLCGHACLCA
ncbi:hypothetical protein K438DRAFT_1612557, partial [Mycena galopus ATCC 62051]